MQKSKRGEAVREAGYTLCDTQTPDEGKKTGCAPAAWLPLLKIREVLFEESSFEIAP